MLSNEETTLTQSNSAWRVATSDDGKYPWPVDIVQVWTEQTIWLRSSMKINHFGETSWRTTPPITYLFYFILKTYFCHKCITGHHIDLECLNKFMLFTLLYKYWITWTYYKNYNADNCTKVHLKHTHAQQYHIDSQIIFKSILLPKEHQGCVHSAPNWRKQTETWRDYLHWSNKKQLFVFRCIAAFPHVHDPAQSCVRPVCMSARMAWT